MELKVWVDGVLRVVCGLSEDTTCQQVVIALAQAIGQTGRYVLVQRLRETERQLLADERPLETLAKLGQLGNEVQFILRRTGPSGSGGSSSDSSISHKPPPPPDRTTSLLSLPLPKHPHPEAPTRREPKKALTFNLGPSSGPHTKPKHFKKPPRDSPELRGASPSPSLAKSPSPSPVPPLPPTPPVTSSSPALPSKEELFRQVLQQQAELRALDEQLDSVQQEVWTWEQPPPPTLPPHLLEELDQLEEAMRQSKAELAHTDHWEEELAAEEEREEALRREAERLVRLLEEHAQRLSDSDGQVGTLERDLRELQQRGGQRNGLRQVEVTQDSLETVRAELDRRQRQEAELRSSLSEAEQELETADRMLETKDQELDELNKELRQCNLQQFIQQTGVPASASSQQDLLADSEIINVSQLVMDTDTDSDSGLFSSGSQTPLTAREILRDTRSLNKPIVLASRELPWR
ncbi:ras association domain-containing protein 7-like isoform X2 [Sardina pilchardus]|uniref:ras association domain-containing protein 7-like isoform X2 n=1 Tax=Sardina pilchardus TaxID=27697 RepID=UPI002E15EAD2